MLCDLCPNVYLDTSSSNSWTRYEEATWICAPYSAALWMSPDRNGCFLARILRIFHAAGMRRSSKRRVKRSTKSALTEDIARLIFHDNLLQLFS